jgi:uncharacterized protein YjbI with pentapeptide repeats
MVQEVTIAGLGALQFDLRAADLTAATFANGTTVTSLLLDEKSCLTDTRFEDVALSGVNLSTTALSGTSFFRSVLRSVKFGRKLERVSFARASLDDADFCDAELLDCSFASANANANGCRCERLMRVACNVLMSSAAIPASSLPASK